MEVSDRPFEDIHTMSMQVIESTNFAIDLEQFAKFSEEIKDYLIKRTDNEEVLKRLQQLPLIDFDAVRFKFWDYIPIIRRFRVGKRRKATQLAVEQVHEIASIYSSIQFLLKAE